MLRADDQAPAPEATVTPDGGPYRFDPHVAIWVVLAAAVVAVVLGHRRLAARAERPLPWPRRQRWALAGAVAAAVVALTWPVADLSAHWSLMVLVFQRVVLVLAVAPLLLLGLPYDVVQWLTAPAPVDAALLRLCRPVTAIVAVTVLLVGSMLPVLVEAQARAPLLRGLLDLVVVGAGLVLWLPVLGRIPGIPRPSPAVRFGYLVAQAVIPAFLSFLYIFATRPLYSVFSGSHRVFGLRPLNDQQVAGFVSKLSLLFVLLIVGAVVLSRAPVGSDEARPDDPLVWADVERELARVERREARAAAHRRPVDRDDAGSGGAPDPQTDAGDGPHRSDRDGPPGG